MIDSRSVIAPYTWQEDALNAIRMNPRVAITGPPGAGKSTACAWAFREVNSRHAALFVTPSTGNAQKILAAQGHREPITVLTNRLLRESSWSGESPPLRAVTTPEVLATGPSSRRLAEHPWELIILDGVDEWSPEARDRGEDLLRHSGAGRSVVTSRSQRLARVMLADALVFNAPAPSHIGAIAPLRYRESAAEADVRHRIEGLTQFVGETANGYGLRDVLRAWESSPYAAQQAALKRLALLRPERDVAAHTRRHDLNDSLLLVAVQGLEVIVDAIDRLEKDAHARRLFQALADELNGARPVWLLTAERATTEYLESELELTRSASRPPTAHPNGRRVRVQHDASIEDWAPTPGTAVVHYDLPSVAVVRERIWMSQRLLKEPLPQWALLRIGDTRARRVLRAVSR